MLGVHFQLDRRITTMCSPTSGPSCLWSQGVWRVSLVSLWPFPSSKMLRKMDPHWIFGWCVFMFSSHTWRTFTKKVYVTNMCQILAMRLGNEAINNKDTFVCRPEGLGNISNFMNMWINKLLQGTQPPKKLPVYIKSSWINDMEWSEWKT